jgi:hypothetical protein
MDKLQSYNVKEIAEKVNKIAEAKSEIILADEETLTLTADDSGKTIVLDKADGVAVALPITEVGLKFKFVVKTTVTSVGYILTAGKATDLFIGAVTMVDTDSSDTFTDQVPDVTNDDVMTLNGSTTGGLIGSYFELECIAETRWWVSGVLRHTSNVANPFA